MSQKVLFGLIEKGAEIFTSMDILSEYQKVLKRDFDYSDEEIKKIMQKIILFVSIIIPNIKIDAVKEDPDDNKILECAISSDVEYILTYDKHLLKLKGYQGIKIITPDEFLKIWMI